MRILSWDIGINNLAYCILDINNDDWKIIDWNVIDTLEDIRPIEHICSSKLKNGKDCKSIAGYYDTDQYYCKKHSPKYHIKAINICKQCNKKTNTKNRLCNIHDPDGIDITKITFYQRAKLIIKKLDQKDWNDIDYAVIENQPVNKNPVMKSIQMIVYTYFMLKIDKEIFLKNAGDKLKVYDGEKIVSNIKSRHDRNKFIAIEHTKYYIKNNDLEYFLSHKKKDDLADSLLQGLHFAKYNIKIINNIRRQ